MASVQNKTSFVAYVLFSGGNKNFIQNKREKYDILILLLKDCYFATNRLLI